MKKTVYITGITGGIGRTLVEGFDGRYELRGCSLKEASVDGAIVHAGDVSDFDFVKRELESEIDVVVHLAADPSPNAEWQSVLKNNIDGTYNIYEAARLAGIKRVVFASTNHVTGILTERWRYMEPDQPVRPDGYYGVSKVCGEAMGRFYADRHGISSINLRIGWHIADGEQKIVESFKDRHDAYPLMWLSSRDCVEVHRCAIDAPAEIRYGVYYAMSGNTGMIWDMRNTRFELGYVPQDNLKDFYAKHGIPYSFKTVDEAPAHAGADEPEREPVGAAVHV